MPKILQSSFRVKLSPEGGAPEIPGVWSTSEGGAVNREVSQVWDGDDYDLVAGKTTADDMTLTRPYDPVRDDGWLNQLRMDMAAGDPCKYSASKTARGPRNSTLGKPEIHPGCPVRTVRTTPTASGSEANPATIELVVASKGPANSAAK